MFSNPLGNNTIKEKINIPFSIKQTKCMHVAIHPLLQQNPGASNYAEVKASIYRLEIIFWFTCSCRLLCLGHRPSILVKGKVKGVGHASKRYAPYTSHPFVCSLVYCLPVVGFDNNDDYYFKFLSL